MGSHVRLTRQGTIAHLILDRPAKHNGLTLEMLEDVVDAARELRRDRSLRAVVVSGEGPSFCAGLDFAATLAQPRRLAAAFVPRPWRGTNTFQEAPWALRRIPVPVIAAVHGNCFGGGLQIALAADLRITAPDAGWSVLEGKWGLIPDMSGVQALSQLVGIETAKRLTMTAEVVSGERAHQLGLAGQLDPDPVAAAASLAEQLSERSPDALASAKRLFDASWQAGDRVTFARERAAQLRLLLTANTARARQAAFAGEPARYRPRRWIP